MGLYIDSEAAERAVGKEGRHLVSYGAPSTTRRLLNVRMRTMVILLHTCSNEEWSDEKCLLQA